MFQLWIRLRMQLHNVYDNRGLEVLLVLQLALRRTDSEDLVLKDAPCVVVDSLKRVLSHFHPSR